MTIKILIADKLAPEGATYLSSHADVEVIENTGLSGDELISAISEVDGVIVRSAVKLPEDVLEKAFSFAIIDLIFWQKEFVKTAPIRRQPRCETDGACKAG